MYQVIGIINLTPDSFYEGSRVDHKQAVIARAQQMVAEGADIIDIGAESSRPGAEPVPLAEEMQRLQAVLPDLVAAIDVPLSVDTYKSEVMAMALDHGVQIINDIRAADTEATRSILARSQARVCLMHMPGNPQTMQQHCHYDHVTQTVKAFFQQRIEQCLQAGISPSQIMIDPGIGFGKNTQQNVQLINELSQLTALGYPLWIGVSRKSLLKDLIGLEHPHERLSGSLALSIASYYQGARYFRTHDVKATKEALATVEALAQLRAG